MFFRVTRSNHDLQALSNSQSKQFILSFIKQSLPHFSLSQSKQSGFLCCILISSKLLVQPIEKLLERVFPSYSEMEPSNLFILSSSLYPLTLRLAEIIP